MLCMLTHSLRYHPAVYISVVCMGRVFRQMLIPDLARPSQCMRKGTRRWASVRR
jgi:hypothetical protein